MGRLTELLKSVRSLGSRKDTAAKQEKRALDRWENEGGPVAEDPRQRCPRTSASAPGPINPARMGRNYPIGAGSADLYAHGSATDVFDG